MFLGFTHAWDADDCDMLPSKFWFTKRFADDRANVYANTNVSVILF